MKRKLISKKLVLNKQTLSNLNDANMGNVKGGNKTGITCGIFCDTVNFSCEETMCGSCGHTCPATFCDTECSC